VLLLISGIMPHPYLCGRLRHGRARAGIGGADGRAVPYKTDEEITDFLRTARLLSSRTGEGITVSHVVLLEKNGVRMRAVSRTFRQRRQVVLPSGRQIEVRDDFRTCSV
jgi:hypothetical protein